MYDGDQHWDLLLLHLPAPLCPRLLVPPWRLVFLFWRTFLPVISSWTICFCDNFFKTILRNHNFLGHTPSLKILAIILTHVSKDCVDWDHFPALDPFLSSWRHLSFLISPEIVIIWFPKRLRLVCRWLPYVRTEMPWNMMVRLLFILTCFLLISSL